MATDTEEQIDTDQGTQGNQGTSSEPELLSLGHVFVASPVLQAKVVLSGIDVGGNRTPLVGQVKVKKGELVTIYGSEAGFPLYNRIFIIKNKSQALIAVLPGNLKRSQNVLSFPVPDLGEEVTKFWVRLDSSRADVQPIILNRTFTYTAAEEEKKEDGKKKQAQDEETQNETKRQHAAARGKSFEPVNAVVQSGETIITGIGSSISGRGSAGGGSKSSGQAVDPDLLETMQVKSAGGHGGREAQFSSSQDVSGEVSVKAEAPITQEVETTLQGVTRATRQQETTVKTQASSSVEATSQVNVAGEAAVTTSVQEKISGRVTGTGRVGVQENVRAQVTGTPGQVDGVSSGVATKIGQVMETSPEAVGTTTQSSIGRAAVSQSGAGVQQAKVDARVTGQFPSAEAVVQNIQSRIKNKLGSEVRGIRLNYPRLTPAKLAEMEHGLEAAISKDEWGKFAVDHPDEASAFQSQIPELKDAVLRLKTSGRFRVAPSNGLGAVQGTAVREGVGAFDSERGGGKGLQAGTSFKTTADIADRVRAFDKNAKNLERAIRKNGKGPEASLNRSQAALPNNPLAEKRRELPGFKGLGEPREGREAPGNRIDDLSKGVGEQGQPHVSGSGRGGTSNAPENTIPPSSSGTSSLPNKTGTTNGERGSSLNKNSSFPPSTPAITGGRSSDAAKKAMVQEVNMLLDALLMQGATLVWGSALPTFFLSVLAGALIGDFLWAFKNSLISMAIRRLPGGLTHWERDSQTNQITGKAAVFSEEEIAREIKISSKVKVQIAAMNAVILAFIFAAVVAVFVFLYAICNAPGTAFLQYGNTYGQICKSINQIGVVGSFNNAMNNIGSQISGGKFNTNQWDQQIIQNASQYGVDPCVVKVVVQKESGGNPNAVGHDSHPKASDLENLNNPPTFDLNWNYSHGIGLTQWTIFPYDGRNWMNATTPSRNLFGQWYTGTDFLNPNTSLNLTARSFAQRIQQYGDIRTAFRSYNGSGPAAENYADSAMQLYNLCRGQGAINN